MHPSQLLADARVLWADEIEVRRQRFHGAQGLPQLMNKISERVFTMILSHSGPPNFRGGMIQVIGLPGNDYSADQARSKSFF
jgi:hypothetical protein